MKSINLLIIFFLTIINTVDCQEIKYTIEPVKSNNIFKDLKKALEKAEERNDLAWPEVGYYNVNQDERIEALMLRDFEILKKEKGFDGYRVQIFFSSGNNSKKAINDTKAEFLKKHPNVPTYTVYHSPNFKLRVGNFRNRFEAFAFYEKVKNDFPSAFIVNDRIEFIQE